MAGKSPRGRLLKAGKKVAVIERELIGRECAYWACVPSKTVLRPPEAPNGSAPGGRGVGGGAGLDRNQRLPRYMIRHLDDKDQIDGYARHGAVVIKEEARVTGPGRIRAGDRELSADHIIIATGSEPVIPALEGWIRSRPGRTGKSIRPRPSRSGLWSSAGVPSGLRRPPSWPVSESMSP
ncbi:MAG: hypothetical protein NVSMB43_02330 [Pseudarthrobacter sp.]